MTLFIPLCLIQLLQFDITPTINKPVSSNDEEREREKFEAQIVSFTPAAVGHILVVTSNGRLMKFSADTGQLLTEVII